MYKILIIGLGGFAGAVLRYGTCAFFQNYSKNNNLPIGTLAVNLIGCLLFGFLSQLAETHKLFSPELRSFIFIGFLGAFTTFSTFGSETINLIRDGSDLFALVNIFLHLGLGFSCLIIGKFLSSLFLNLAA